MVPSLVRFAISLQLSNSHPKGTLHVGGEGHRRGTAGTGSAPRSWPLASGFLCQSNPRKAPEKGTGRLHAFVFCRRWVALRDYYELDS